MLLPRKAILILSLLFSMNQYSFSQNGQVTIYTTTNDKQSLFSESNAVTTSKKVDATQKIRSIGIDAATQYQPIDGFGFALTGGSAQHLVHMSAAARRTLFYKNYLVQVKMTSASVTCG